MKPDAAAERLAEVRIELAAGILMKLDPRAGEHHPQRDGQQGGGHHHRRHGERRAQGRPVMIRMALAARRRWPRSPAALRPLSRRSACRRPCRRSAPASQRAGIRSTPIPEKPAQTGQELLAVGRPPEPALHRPARIVGRRHPDRADLDQRPRQAEERIGAQPHHQAHARARRLLRCRTGSAPAASADGDINSDDRHSGQRRHDAFGKHRPVDRRGGHRGAAQRQSDDQRLAGGAGQRRAPHPHHRRHRAADRHRRRTTRSPTTGSPRRASPMAGAAV